MKTAVEWFVEQIKIKEEIDFIPSELIKQAKEMEKKQIIMAFEIGYDNGACVNDGESVYHGNNYYNNTYKSE